MLGQTNTFKQSGNSGGGDTIQAVNRTGVSIGKGAKVWVIPQAQQAGDGFTIYRGSDGNTEFITDNNCNYIRYSSGLYYLGNGSSELITGGFSSFVSDAIYNYGGSSASVTTGNYRINILFNGEVIVPDYVASRADFIIPSSNQTKIYWGSTSSRNIYSYDKETDKFIEYTNQDNLGFASDSCFFIKDSILYCTGLSYRWYAKLDESSSCFTKLGDLTISGHNQIAPLGLTSDGKIIGIYARNSNTTFGVLFAELISESELKIYTSEEASQLAECYYGVSNIYARYFPDSQILTYVKCRETSSLNDFIYGVFKYNADGKWQKLNVVLPAEVPENLGYSATQYCKYLAVSTDMSRCIVGYWVSSSSQVLYRYQLENFDGNNLYQYRREIITENCLTGKANQDILSGESGEVSTVLL